MSIRVALVACPGYQPEAVEEAVDRALQLLGGMSRFVRPGESVVVRPNLISPRPVASAATTHPAVVAAVVRRAQAAGGKITIGDCPGGITGSTELSHSYQVSGMADVAERSGARLDYDLAGVEVAHPQGRFLKRATLVRSVVDSDVTITIPKLKTHALTGLTGAVKLCFGAMPGKAKIGYHLRYPKVEDFSGALLDLHDMVRPRVTIMDAVVGMDGNGPTGGDPRHIGAILASEDSLACDLIATELVGLDRRGVSTLRVAVQQERLGAKLDLVQVVGDQLLDLRVEGFRPARVQLLTQSSLFNRLVDLFGRWVSPHPVATSECVGCAVCAQNCPQGAIVMLRGNPVIDAGRCIHCFCCQELCPVGAMQIYYPRLTRWWTRST